jgi:hypothetical protein
VNSCEKAGSEVPWVVVENHYDAAAESGDLKDQTTDPAWRRTWLRHEVLLLLLGMLTTAALACFAGPLHGTTIQTLAATILFGVTVSFSRSRTSVHWQKFRFVAAYGFVLWFYTAVETLVPALHQNTRDAQLLAADAGIFGATPAVVMQSWSSTWTNELFSGSYFSYLVYLHVCLVHAIVQPVEETKRFARWLFSIYAVGLAGYVLFPAVGPGEAFPDLFGHAIEGPYLTRFNRMVVEHGSSVYDAFPSLHVLITCALLDYDRRFHRKRFACMIIPALGIFTSAMYLRYHYAVDLIAGGILFLLLWFCFCERNDVSVEARHAK